MMTSSEAKSYSIYAIFVGNWHLQHSIIQVVVQTWNTLRRGKLVNGFLENIKFSISLFMATLNRFYFSAAFIPTCWFYGISSLWPSTDDGCCGQTNKSFIQIILYHKNLPSFLDTKTVSISKRPFHLLTQNLTCHKFIKISRERYKIISKIHINLNPDPTE